MMSVAMIPNAMQHVALQHVAIKPHPSQESKTDVR